VDFELWINKGIYVWLNEWIWLGAGMDMDMGLSLEWKYKIVNDVGLLLTL